MIGPEFTDDERFAIVEYLKIHRDLPETPAGYQPPECRLSGARILRAQARDGVAQRNVDHAPGERGSGRARAGMSLRAAIWSLV